jgi:hypothetical protein
MLFSLREQKTSGFDRLTFMCNRLLTLVSLPSSVMSHRSVREHQKAHLTLLRRMLAQKPQIPITREGYRALIKLQLIHEKTDDERAWARAKSDSWPPWQKSKLGIEDSLEYPGKESRAMKMLRRMTEAGYMHGLWEKAAAVLAGWDTDKSPTIQTRQILGMPPSAALDMSPVQSVTTLFGKDNATGPVMMAQLWAARVSATRSAREAWACFCEYHKSIDRGLKRLEPYHAMLEKLLARRQEAEVDPDIMPGDVREVHDDPISQRDLVYLETDVPSSKDFYRLMLSDGVQPAGRLLSLLVTNARSIDECIQYLLNSSYSEMKKDVLLHAHDYSASTIRDTLAGIPYHFLAAFLGLISSFETLPSEDCFQFRQGPGLNPGKQEKIIRPGVYGLLLLRASKTTYLPAYHAILNGVIDRSDSPTQSPSVSTLHKGADLACNILVLLEDLDIQPDLRMFHKFGLVVHNFSKAEIPSNWATSKKTIRRVKALFTVVVYGSRKLSWLPTTTDVQIIRVPDPEHIRMLIEILGLGHDIQSLLEVVDWMAQHTARLRSNYLETAGGVKAMRRALFTLRVFLDGAWADEIDWQRGISAATEEQTAQAQVKLQSLGWPTAEEMTDLMEENQLWLQWVRKAMWKSRRLEEQAVQSRKAEGGDHAEDEKG